MREYVARLIDCGIPRQVAVCVCNDFKRRGKLSQLNHYVKEVEIECGVIDDV